MARIFISYKRVDKEKVFEIKDKIESSLSEKCWIDLDGIESDAQFKNVIIRAINNCEVFLFMYSKTHSTIEDFEKDWTMRELNFAEKKWKRIVFINIDGTPLIDEFEFDFGTKQQIDARSDEVMERLIRDLKRWLSLSKSLADEPIKTRSIEFVSGQKKEMLSQLISALLANKTLETTKLVPTAQQTKNQSKKDTASKQVQRTAIASKTTQDVTLEAKDGHVAVDMGLSVRWATMNIGAKNLADSGDYFAFGETQTKDPSLFTKKGYLLGEPTFLGMKIYKYNSNDKLEFLWPEDDAAVQQWGDGWRMPTDHEMEELIENCTVEKKSINNVDVIQFKSNINGHIIYIPLNGIIKDGVIKETDFYKTASLWTSRADDSFENKAYFTSILPNAKCYVVIKNRWYGCGIRPVKP